MVQVVLTVVEALEVQEVLRVVMVRAAPILRVATAVQVVVQTVLVATAVQVVLTVTPSEAEVAEVAVVRQLLVIMYTLPEAGEEVVAATAAQVVEPLWQQICMIGKFLLHMALAALAALVIHSIRPAAVLEHLVVFM